MIELGVDGKLGLDSIQSLRDALTQQGILPHPNYGADDLHNARLLGAYHMRRGWGDSRLYSEWYLSLSPEDTRYIRWYILRGQPGRTDMGMALFAHEVQESIGVNAVLVGLVAAASRLSEAFVELGRTVARDAESASYGFADVFAQALDSDRIMITIERINLRHNLERAFIPAPIAYWLARRWPAWALPAVAWSRLRNQMAHEGAILLRWLKRLLNK